MTLEVKKIRTAKTLSEVLNKVKPMKRFDAQRHVGKVNWEEDALEYQKRIRDEWG